MTPRKRVPRNDRSESDVREQEVLRANRELAAYFKGRRTEREARSALKIIKAFIRERERTAPANRAPLPGQSPKVAKERIRKKVRLPSNRRRTPNRQNVRDLSRVRAEDDQQSDARRASEVSSLVPGFEEQG